MHNKPSRQYTAVAKHSTLATRVELIFYNKQTQLGTTDSGIAHYVPDGAPSYTLTFLQQ
jgi:hypothetical protein